MKYIISLLTFVAALSAVAQRGKDNDYTVTATNTVVNTYANLTANAAVGATSISVNSNAMSGGAFAGNLAAGDLILIIQMQGASMDIDLTIPTDPVWGPGVYTTPNGHTWDGSWPFFAYKWGQITQYNNSGKFEQVEVRGVSGSNTILLQCGLQHNYTSAGRVQIVRIPRFQNLTLNTNTTMVPTLWNGTTGGIVAVEVNGNLILNSNSRISASAYGFRGGVTTGQVGNTGGNTVSANGAGNGDTFLGSNLGAYGGRKGEGIGGNSTDYIALYSEFGRGAPANGGGGGGTQNSGGGGGANVGVGTYTGKGIPNPTYNTAWNLEMAGFGGSTSPGGGRGGYAYSTSNQDANVTGPNNTAWGGNARKVNGGLGGHALVADATRIFMGGGGGAGDQDSGQGGAGGRGGGIAMVTVYGTISGSGIIEADGAVGQKTNPNNQGTSSFPTSNQKKGNDGAGGGGGGGSVYVKNMNAIPATITLSARGGNGGIHDLTICCGASAEATGPGGAGAGGSISLTSGTPSQIVTGGNAGTSNSAHVPEMVVNGATNGGLGISGQAAPTFNITANGATICSGNTANLTASVTGTAPGTVNWYTQQFGGAVIATGASYITPVLTATTTYYVGICPGTFRIPVTVTVNPSPIISGTAVITNAGCTTPGSVTGLTASGGTGTLTYTWNGVSSTGPTLTNAAAGNYILTVTDAAGCSVQSGPHTIVGTGGPTINSTNVLIANEICNGTLGSITGITATGTGLTYSWSPSGGANLNTTSLPQGNYTLTVTDNVGCIATAGPFTVNFVPGPTINATGLIADEFCDQSNGSITGITANGNGLSYSWTNGGGSALDANGLSAGSYTLTVSDINGCIASQGPILIDNIAGPSIDLSNLVLTNENCSQGDGAISGIIVSGGTPAYTIAWTGSASTNLDLASLNAGSFSLTVTDQAGCVDQAGPFDIQNVGGPVINATNVNVVNMACDGTPGAITGISATGTDLAYQWTNGGGTTLDANGLSAGSYSLTVTDGNGCSVSTGPYSITAPNFISIDITNMVLTQTACTSNTGSVSGITYSGGGTGITVSWSNGANTLNLSGLGMGSYTLTVSDDQGCSDQETVEILMNNAPNIDLTGLIVEDGHCSQADGSITGITVSGGTPAYTYLWNGNNTLNSLDLNTIQGGNFVLVVTDAAGCSDTETIIVNDVAAPQITDQALIVAQPTCTSFGSISGLAVAGEAPFDFVWSGDTLFTLDINLLPPGSYTLTVTDNFACSSVYGPIVLTPPAGPTAAFVYSPAAPNEGDLITFTNTSSGAGPLSSTWTIETETFTTTDAQYAFALEGTYLVVLQVIDVNGCIALTQQVVSIFGELTIPNVITPNGDNVNETFEVQGLKPNTGLVILNRWGNVVFETDNYQNDWNGSDAGGNMLTEGVYTYLLQPENDSPKHGFVHLMR